MSNVKGVACIHKYLQKIILDFHPATQFSSTSSATKVISFQLNISDKPTVYYEPITKQQTDNIDMLMVKKGEHVKR